MGCAQGMAADVTRTMLRLQMILITGFPPGSLTDGTRANLDINPAGFKGPSWKDAKPADAKIGLCWGRIVSEIRVFIFCMVSFEKP